MKRKLVTEIAPDTYVKHWGDRVLVTDSLPSTDPALPNQWVLVFQARPGWPLKRYYFQLNEELEVYA